MSSAREFVGCEHHDSVVLPAEMVALLSEGICPDCKCPGERSGEWSVCPCCAAGWRLEPGFMCARIPLPEAAHPGRDHPVS